MKKTKANGVDSPANGRAIWAADPHEKPPELAAWRGLALGVLKNAIDQRDVEWLADPAPDALVNFWLRVADQPKSRILRAAIEKLTQRGYTAEQLEPLVFLHRRIMADDAIDRSRARRYAA